MFDRLDSHSDDTVHIVPSGRFARLDSVEQKQKKGYGAVSSAKTGATETDGLLASNYYSPSAYLRRANLTFALVLLGAIPVLIIARVALDVGAPLLEKVCYC